MSGNKYAQVYGTSFGWAHAHPIRFKSEAHKTLSVLFKCNGVPPEMVLNGSKEQNLGQFHQKLKDACCYKRQTEPHSPWSNAAEGKINEVKKFSSRKMIKTGMHKYMWEHSLELESLIRSNKALDYHIFDGEVPEMLMTRQAAYIIHICEYAWFDWFMFSYGPHVSYPDNNLVLGRYLWPTLDVGSAMCAKILKNIGKVVPRSTLRTFTREEIDSPVHKEHI